MSRYNTPSSRKRGPWTAALAALAACGLATLGVLNTVAAGTVIAVDSGDPKIATLFFNGPVIDGDLGRLQAATAKITDGRRIVLMLESGGGKVGEGLAIGRYIYANKITTMAIQGPGCHSACSYMFLAGRDVHTELPSRIKMKGSLIGFHQSRLATVAQKAYSADDINGATRIGQEFVKDLNAYFNEIKADPEFLTLSLSAPSSSLTYLNDLDALRLGIYVFDPAFSQLLTPDQFRPKTPPN